MAGLLTWALQVLRGSGPIKLGAEVRLPDVRDACRGCRILRTLLTAMLARGGLLCTDKKAFEPCSLHQIVCTQFVLPFLYMSARDGQLWLELDVSKESVLATGFGLPRPSRTLPPPLAPD